MDCRPPQRGCNQHWDLRGKVGQYSTHPPQPEPYKAASPLAVGELRLWSVSWLLSILWFNKTFLCFWTKLGLILLALMILGRKTLFGAQLERAGNNKRLTVLPTWVAPNKTPRIWVLGQLPWAETLHTYCSISPLKEGVYSMWPLTGGKISEADTWLPLDTTWYVKGQISRVQLVDIINYSWESCVLWVLLMNHWDLWTVVRCQKHISTSSFYFIYLFF